MRDRLPIGKVPWDIVKRCLADHLPPEVVLGPAAGEDAALVTIGGELWAIASDPISYTAVEAGRLAVIVNANDVAVRGAVPRFFLAVVLLAQEEASERAAEVVVKQVQETCDRLGVTLIGGHTEVTPDLGHSVVVGTMLGRVESRPVTTGGLRLGDRLGMTKWAGLEGTAILLSEFGDRLREVHGDNAFRGCQEILAGDWLSVVPEATVAAANPGVTSLHDVTEGGVGEAVYEMECASETVIELDLDAVPVLPETQRICGDLGIDPLGLIGSGALLVGCSPESSRALAADLSAADIPFSWIGRVVAGDRERTKSVPRFERDELLKAWCVEGVQAVLFDMDGTLIDSDYDWPAIRERLGVTAASIIEELNGLPEPDRQAKWDELVAIERSATLEARLKPGVADLLTLLEENEIRTALVTNNSEDNTHLLLQRFDLVFDVVLTRDSGLWKPSGAPLVEAMRRLDVPPARCLAVGDSRYDVQAAREAGCGAVCVVYGAAERYADRADLAFPDLSGLSRYLRIVL